MGHGAMRYFASHMKHISTQTSQFSSQRIDNENSNTEDTQQHRIGIKTIPL